LPVSIAETDLKTACQNETTDALGISGNGQKGKDRRDADHLEKRLCKRQREDRGKLAPAIWSREKENAANQVDNV